MHGYYNGSVVSFMKHRIIIVYCPHTQPLEQISSECEKRKKELTQTWQKEQKKLVGFLFCKVGVLHRIDHCMVHWPSIKCILVCVCSNTNNKVLNWWLSSFRNLKDARYIVSDDRKQCNCHEKICS